MKRFNLLLVMAVGFGLLFSGAQLGSEIQSKAYKPKIEPDNGYVYEENGDCSPIHYPDVRNNFYVSLIDSSLNGYGLIVGQTNPLSVSDAGWLFGYRQWAGETGTSGQIGAAYSSNGLNWTTYTNLNPNTSARAGRYPSVIGTEDYPYVFWNEYTGLGTGYGGRPYYAYDEFGWDGGSFSQEYDVDILWNDSKDFWVGSPVHAYDPVDDMNYFNVSYSDWTRDNLYMFHSEAYDDGYIIFGNEIVIFDIINDFVGGDDEGKYNSDAVTGMNADGVGYVATSAYFLGADQIPGTSPWSNVHNIIFKMTEDYGTSWTGGLDGSPYIYIPDEVWEGMMGPNYPEGNEFPAVYVDECDGTEIVFDGLFATYDLDVKVDSEGNPHFVVGVIVSGGEGVYPGMPYNGIYHFWCDKDYLLNPGDVNTETGWNYSRIIDTGDMWRWDNADGESYWQGVFPSLAISEVNEDVMWIVVSGPDQGEFVVTDDGGTPEDECDDTGYFPTWNEEVYVVKSLDGGATWWCPYNVTQTETDCWVNEDTGEYECSDDELCADGITLDEPSEVNAHAGTGATDDTVPIVYQTPDWCGGPTTGDMSAQNHKTRLWAGWVDQTTEDCPGGCTLLGDVNHDEAVDILDIVGILNYILFGNDEFDVECADFNGDGEVDILDIVGILNHILFGPGRVDNATYANITQVDNSVNLNADGFVGAVQMTISHGSDFDLTLSGNAMVGNFVTENNKTTLIVVGLENGELFTANSEFEIESIVAAAGDDYLNTNVVDSFALLSNYPNPFNPETTINYDIAVDGVIELSIYNVLGQRVTTLVNEYKNVGPYTAVWAGMDEQGNQVGSGVYIMQLTSNNEVITNKITLLR